MNEANFVSRVNYLATGDGYRHSTPSVLLADLKTAAGTSLTSASAPALVALETNFIGVKAAAGTTFAGLLEWLVPADYDAAADDLRIRIACNMSGNTNSGVTFTPAIYRKRPVPSIIPDLATALPAGLALSADLGVPASSVIPLLGSNLLTQWVETNADYWNNLLAPELRSSSGAANRSLAATADASLQAGDIIVVNLNTTAHATDDINIYAITFWYRSNLAFTDVNSR